MLEKTPSRRYHSGVSSSLELSTPTIKFVMGVAAELFSVRMLHKASAGGLARIAEGLFWLLICLWTKPR